MSAMIHRVPFKPDEGKPAPNGAPLPPERAAVDFLWDQAQALSPGSCARAWLLRIRAQLTRYLGDMPRTLIDANLEAS